MNMPKRASRHHWMRCSRVISPAVAGPACALTGANAVITTANAVAAMVILHDVPIMGLLGWQRFGGLMPYSDSHHLAPLADHDGVTGG